MTKYKITRFGFRQQEPLPTETELQAFYAEVYYQAEQGQYQASYDDEEKAWFDLDPAVAHHVMVQSAPGAPQELLDVGCGEGFFMAGLLRRGWKVRGCDFSTFGIGKFNPNMLPVFEQGNIYD